MRLHHLTAALEALAPPALALPYDNSGLLVGEPDAEITGVLVTLDCLEATVQEAIDTGCNVIVAHHPIVFSGLKRLTGRTYVERVVMEALRAGVALYAIHTNLDSVLTQGVSGRLAAKLSLRGVTTLQPAANALQKLAVYVPMDPADLVDQVAAAMWAAGAGQIGHYDQASFRTAGTGTFRPLAGAEPAIGSAPAPTDADADAVAADDTPAAGARESVPEHKLEVVVPRVLAKAVLRAAREAHPYEEMAYDLYDVAGHHPDYGMGAVGDLPEAMSYDAWLDYLCARLDIPGLKATADAGRPIRRVAVCGGSGSSLLDAARASGAEAYVTADFKYHEFFNAEDEIVICDVGHYESERHTTQLLYEYISTRFGTFAARMTQLDTNPARLYVRK